MIQLSLSTIYKGLKQQHSLTLTTTLNLNIALTLGIHHTVTLTLAMVGGITIVCTTTAGSFGEHKSLTFVLTAPRSLAVP